MLVESGLRPVGGTATERADDCGPGVPEIQGRDPKGATEGSTAFGEVVTVRIRMQPCSPTRHAPPRIPGQDEPAIEGYRDEPHKVRP